MFDIDIGYNGLRRILKTSCGDKWYQKFKGFKPIEFRIPHLLEDQVIKDIKDRMAFNQRNNRTDKRDYVLTGFIRCDKCNYALSGSNNNGRRVYQHSNMINGKQKFCMSVPAYLIEAAVFQDLMFSL